MRRFLQRNIVTVIKLPFAAVWDVISLGNMGEGTSTGKAIQEHRNQKAFDEQLDRIEESNKSWRE